MPGGAMEVNLLPGSQKHRAISTTQHPNGNATDITALPRKAAMWADGKAMLM